MGHLSIVIKSISCNNEKYVDYLLQHIEHNDR